LKKIGIVVSRIDKGAAELLEVTLAKDLTKLGYEVYLIAMYSAKLFHDEAVEAELAKEVTAIVRVDYDLKSNPFLILKKIFQVRALNIACFISHNRGTDLFSFLFSLGTKSKQIKAFHEYFEPSDQHTLMDKFWAFIVHRVAYSYHITTHSLEVNSKTFHLDPDRVSVVQNVLNLTEIREKSSNFRALYKIDKTANIILTVARIVPNKGIELNLKIMIPLLKKDPNLYYLIAGDTNLDKAYYHLLLEEIAHHNLEKQIRFIHFQKNIVALMKESKVLLHFARHEAFGLVLIEALYATLPIVASRVGGIPQVLAESSFQTFSLDSLDEARDEVAKYIYQGKRESYCYASTFFNRTSIQRAEEVALLIEKVCSLRS